MRRNAITEAVAVGGLGRSHLCKTLGCQTTHLDDLEKPVRIHRGSRDTADLKTTPYSHTGTHTAHRTHTETRFTHTPRAPSNGSKTSGAHTAAGSEEAAPCDAANPTRPFPVRLLFLLYMFDLHVQRLQVQWVKWEILMIVLSRYGMRTGQRDGQTARWGSGRREGAAVGRPSCPKAPRLGRGRSHPTEVRTAGGGVGGTATPGGAVQMARESGS